MMNKKSDVSIDGQQLIDWISYELLRAAESKYRMTDKDLDIEGLANRLVFQFLNLDTPLKPSTLGQWESLAGVLDVLGGFVSVHNAFASRIRSRIITLIDLVRNDSVSRQFDYGEDDRFESGLCGGDLIKYCTRKSEVLSIQLLSPFNCHGFGRSMTAADFERVQDILNDSDDLLSGFDLKESIDQMQGFDIGSLSNIALIECARYADMSKVDHDRSLYLYAKELAYSSIS